MPHQEIMVFNSRDELLRIDLHKIVFFKADGNYTDIYLANRLQCKVGMNLAQMQKALADRLGEKAQIFARIGKSHIVNMNYVFQINVLKQRLLLSDLSSFNFPIEVSRDALKRLKELMVPYNDTERKP